MPGALSPQSTHHGLPSKPTSGLAQISRTQAPTTLCVSRRQRRTLTPLTVLNISPTRPNATLTVFSLVLPKLEFKSLRPQATNLRIKTRLRVKLIHLCQALLRIIFALHTMRSGQEVNHDQLSSVIVSKTMQKLRRLNLSLPQNVFSSLRTHTL